MRDSKRDLRHYRALVLELEELQQMEINLRLKQLPSGISYDKDRVQTSPENKIESYGWELLEIEEQIKNVRATIANKLSKIHAAICRMQNPNCRTLIRLRYIDGCSWQQVAEMMNYSESWLKRRLHSNALLEFDKTYKEDT